jgi:ABC-type branched-subunit amino acid transport system ATPase component/ABC-type branched-subunit amino acid transport system permease subunit
VTTRITRAETLRRCAVAVGIVAGLWLALELVLPHTLRAGHTSTGQWQTPLSVVTLGFITGAAYGLLAVGIVLVYRASRVVNFAHGEVGAFAAACFGIEVVRWHMPYWLAVPPALVVGAAVSVAIDVVVVRRLGRAPLIMSVVATLAAGQFLSLLALVVNSHANAALLFPQPTGLPSFTIGDLPVTPAYTGILILAPLAVVTVGLFLARTRYGRGIRSAAANPDAARLAGVPVRRMTAVAWAIAGALAAISAILTQASSGFNSGDSFGPSLLLIALTGAVLGRLRSLAGALAGGLAVGLSQQLLLWNYSSDTGLVELVLFIGILLALLVLDQPVGRGAAKDAWVVASRRPPLPAQVRRLAAVRLLDWVPWLGLAAVLGVLPLLVSNATSIRLAITFAFVIVALSVGVVTGLSGQLSLGQFAVAAVGAYVSYEISKRTGNFFLSFALAGLGGAATTVALGVPAVRARGLLLAVTTLAFSLVMPDYLISRQWLFGAGTDPGRPILFHHAFVSGHSYYYVGLATLAVALLVARNVRRGAVARRLLAVRDNEDAARAFALGATSLKVQGYAYAGFLAGLGGAMYGHALSQIGLDAFPSAASIDVVKIAVVGGLGALSGPLWGAGLIQGPTYLTLGSLGLALVSLAQLAVILALPGGVVQIADWCRARLATLAARGAGVLATNPAATPDLAPAAPKPLPAMVRRSADSPQPAGQPLLDVTGLAKAYDGIHAVRGLDLTVATGEVVGIIGPNGAGKTTALELIAGFLPPDSGRVCYRGVDVTRRSPQARGRLGLIRSFQDAALFPTLTVLDCVALAAERQHRTSAAIDLLGVGWSERRLLAAASELLGWAGLGAVRDTPVRELSTGTRRLVELTCLVALGPQLLLLDEPSAGVAQAETDALGDLLVGLRSTLGVSMIVVEHDIPLVMRLADRVLCMADGAVVASGTPTQVQADPQVVAAFLGAPANARQPQAGSGGVPAR